MKVVLICFLMFSLTSCFLIKIPIEFNSVPVTDTVKVYHFIVSSSLKKIADTAMSNNFERESKEAYDWITEEAAKNGQKLTFKEFWPLNKDPKLRNTFIHKLPSSNLQKLLIKKRFKKVKHRKSKYHKKEIEIINWEEALFDSLTKQIKDSSISKVVKNSNDFYNQSNNQLIVIHLLKARKSKILGFYNTGTVYLGNNKSGTVAHETIHYLGAPDLYIHKFWFGKRRRIVNDNLKHEIMNDATDTNNDCTTYFLSNYTAYTIGWNKNIESEYRPILKYNLMAKIVFYISLFI